LLVHDGMEHSNDKLTSCAVGERGHRNRIAITDGDSLDVRNDPLFLQLLGPAENPLVAAVVSGNEKEVGASGLWVLAEDVL
jgi:hypothetical protein